MKSHYFITLLGASSLALSLAQSEPVVTDPILSQEIQARNLRLQEGTVLYEQAKVEYSKNNYDQAISIYRQALGRIPNAPLTQDLRGSIRKDLQQARYDLAKDYYKQGRHQEALEILSEIESEDENNKKAQKLTEYINDPIRTNKAVDQAYLAKREQVNQLLYVAEGYYDAGLFDKASLEYEKILILDPYNKAARMGMTKVEQEKAGYYETAYQESRASYLNQIAAQWEKPISVTSLRATQLQGTLVDNDNGAEITSKALDDIIIPSIDLEDMNLYEAIEQIRQLSKEYDTRTNTANRGLNFVVRDNGDVTNPIAARRIDKISLNSVPLRYILESVCSKLDLGFKAEEFAVVLFPKGDGNGVLRQRTFLVPPDFKTALSDSSSTNSTLAPNDPFAPAPAAGGGTSANASIQELLQGRGIKFTDNASASLVGNKLIVSNTQENIDLLESIINEIKLKTNTAVRIVSKFMEINQNDLDELSFDWNLADSNNRGITGGTTGSGLERLTSDFTAGSTDGIVTSGLRSGSGAISSTALSSIVGNAQRLSGQNVDSVAPGVLSFLDNDFLNGSQLELVMRGLSQKKGVDILIAPSVMAKNNQEALIEVVDEMRYPTSYEAPQIPTEITASTISPVAPANPTDFEIENLGVSLRVTPNLGANNQTISLDFKPTIVEFDGFINYGSPINGYDSDADTNGDGIADGQQIEITANSIEQPVFSRRKIETQLTLYDGNTVAVGGLIKEERITIEDKVPILGDLPFIGRLFQSQIDSQDRSNLVIFVTARVVDASGEAVNKLNPGVEEALMPESLVPQ